MRVLHVVRQFHPSVGGLESVVLSLSRQQRRSGIEAEVLTLNRLFREPDVRLPSNDLIEEIPVRRISYSGSRRYPLAPGVLSHVKNFDLIHVHGVDFFADYLAATSNIHGRPLVLSTHGGFFHTNFAHSLKRLYFKTVTRATLRKYRRVFACSENDARTFEAITDRQLKLIENGVDTDKFANAASRDFSPSLVYFGRFASHKGLQQLLEVFKHVKAVLPEARLTLIGSDWDGTLKKLQQQRAEELHDVGIVIEPDLDDNAIFGRLNRCSFFVSASQYEGFGLTVVEAISAGLIPIVNRIPTFEKIVNTADVGLVADFNDTEATTHAIVEFIMRCSKQHGLLRDRAIDASQRYNWHTVEKAFRAEYENVIGLKRRNILGVEIDVTTRDAMVDRLDDALDRGQSVPLAFANAHTLNVADERPGFRTLLKRFVVLNDGFGVDIASKMKFGSKFPENLNGTDFVPHFLGVTRHRLRIFLLGAHPHVVKAAARRFADAWPQHDIVGAHDGYFRGEQQTLEVCRAINQSKADIVLVGLGNPLQEQWISRYGPGLDPKLQIAVGALFDFFGGNVKRAPAWIRRARCEWMYRLAQEPRRLFSRYLIGNVAFLRRALSDRRQGLTP